MGVIITSLLATVSFGLLQIADADVLPTDLLQDPSPDEWRALAKYGGTLTRDQFEERLKDVFDPGLNLAPFLTITDRELSVFSSADRKVLLATIPFSTAAPTSATPSSSTPSPPIFTHEESGAPLAGLRVVVDPADIGGRWGAIEDRSSYYKGYGWIQEGDLNLNVSRVLEMRLRQLGAEVFVTRDRTEPVSGLSVADVAPIVPKVLSEHTYILSASFHARTRNVRKSDPIYQRIVADILLTKNLEARSRAANARQTMHPDITIILQFDATSASRVQRLASTNRNILFVEGAYTATELTSDPRQRLRLLTKLLQNVTPTEERVALAISSRLKEMTGFPPVLYGNSKTTRAIAGSPYVVARNLLLNREHDGPVVVTEPYFMNQPVTLQRLIAGDYVGLKMIGGQQRPSIYHEYAEAVAQGLVDAYRSQPLPLHPESRPPLPLAAKPSGAPTPSQGGVTPSGTNPHLSL